ncbi:MAG TPA: glycosyltransferase [Burkholderiaceae bacterium]|nr:glycosyltransferase [Burkholderiaceae bacterium]
MLPPIARQHFETLLLQRRHDALLGALDATASALPPSAPPGDDAGWFDDLLRRAAVAAFGARPEQPAGDVTLYLVNGIGALGALREWTRAEPAGRALVVATTAAAWDAVRHDYRAAAVLDDAVIDRAASLLDLHAACRPARTLLLGPLPDVAALAAAAVQPAAQRWSFVHHAAQHAAQHAALGGTLDALLHLDPLPARCRACQRAGVRHALYVPAPRGAFVTPAAPASTTPAPTPLAWPPVAATFGDAACFFDPSSPNDYLDFLAVVLPRVAAYYHVGELSAKQLKTLRARVGRHANFHVVAPPADDIATVLRQVGASLYVDPPRKGRVDSALEALGAGVPAVCRRPSSDAPDETYASLGDAVLHWDDLRGLAGLLKGLTPASLQAAATRGRDALAAYFPADAYRRYRPSVEFAVRLPPAPAFAKAPEAADGGAAGVSSFDPATKDLEILAQLAPDATAARHAYQEFLNQRDAARRPPAGGPGQPAASCAIVIGVTREQFPLLADTVDSLAALRSSGWRLAVVSPEAQPDPIFTESPQFTWTEASGASGSAAETLAHERLVAAAREDWIALLPAGARLAPDALAHLARHAAEHPHHAAVYCDHDEVDAHGARGQPTFKPDFNLDLLRSVDYVSGTTFFRRDALLRLVEPDGDTSTRGAFEDDHGNDGAGDGARAYDLLWRLHDQAGADAIGHLAEPLVSLPAAVRGVAAPARRRIVAAHLRRSGIAATVSDDVVSGACRVQHRHPGDAAVTAVIAHRDEPERLEACIDSLLDRTTGARLDLVVVDYGSVRATTFATYAAARMRHGTRLQVLRDPAIADPASALMAGARASEAPFLLLLSADVEIVETDWLQVMLAHAHRPDVGAVGCRIDCARTGLVQEAGLVLGAGGPLDIAAPASRFERAANAGPWNRVAADQDVTALSGHALLVRRADFDASGGLDAANLATTGHVIDLCLKLRRAGRRLVWTPYARVIRHSTRSAAERSAELPPPARERDRRERRTLLKRWACEIAGDPLGARHGDPLTADPRLPNTDFPDLFPSDATPVPRIVALATGGDDDRTRRAAHVIATSGAARARAYAPRSGRLPTPVELVRLRPDALLIQHPSADVHLDLLDLVRDVIPGLRRVASFDALLYETPPSAGAYDHYAHHAHEARARLQRLARRIDAIVVPTEALAAKLRGVFTEVHVIPDRPRRSAWAHVAPRRPPGARLRIGWDAQSLAAADRELVRALVAATQGSADWFDAAAGAPLDPAQLEAVAAVAARGAGAPRPERLAALQLDVVVAPLAAHPLHEDRTDLHLREFAAAGVAILCAGHPAYAEVPAHRPGTDATAWTAALQACLRDRAAAHRAGDRLRAWVHAGDWAEDQAARWLAALGVSPRPVDAPAPTASSDEPAIEVQSR